MNWNRNLLTDSGGFQIHFLLDFAKAAEIRFRIFSHRHGLSHVCDKFLLILERIFVREIQSLS